MCRTQGLDPALVCGAVFPNSLPCVRHGAGRGGACCRAGAPGPRRRALPVLTATGADGRYRRRALSGAATPTRVVGMSARCPHRRALYPPRGVDNPLTMSTAPSRRQYPPRGVDNPLTMSTTPSRCRQRASAFAPPRFHCGRRGPCPPGCAHKDPGLRNTHRTQGLDPALVCGAVLLNSIPCVRHPEDGPVPTARRVSPGRCAGRGPASWLRPGWPATPRSRRTRGSSARSRG